MICVQIWSLLAAYAIYAIALSCQVSFQGNHMQEFPRSCSVQQLTCFLAPTGRWICICFLGRCVCTYLLALPKSPRGHLNPYTNILIAALIEIWEQYCDTWVSTEQAKCFAISDHLDWVKVINTRNMTWDMYACQSSRRLQGHHKSESKDHILKAWVYKHIVPLKAIRITI